jgi:hypothetical protein
LKSWCFIPAAVLLLAACDRETPTEAGAGLLPPGAVQTFEVILDAQRYLVQDTAFGLYTDPRDAPFVIIANEFEGELTSHALVRFSIPTLLTVPDTAGVPRLDSVPNYFAGSVRMVIDTSVAAGQSVQIAVYHTVEGWDASATWTHRIDTAGVGVPWSVPGGARGELVGRVTVAANADTVIVPVDSLDIARWLEIADGSRGALVVIETPDVRLRTSIPALFLEARPSLRPDTVIERWRLRPSTPGSSSPSCRGPWASRGWAACRRGARSTGCASASTR